MFAVVVALAETESALAKKEADHPRAQTVAKTAGKRVCCRHHPPPDQRTGPSRHACEMLQYQSAKKPEKPANPPHPPAHDPGHHLPPPQKLKKQP